MKSNFKPTRPRLRYLCCNFCKAENPIYPAFSAGEIISVQCLDISINGAPYRSWSFHFCCAPRFFSRFIKSPRSAASKYRRLQRVHGNPPSTFTEGHLFKMKLPTVREAPLSKEFSFFFLKLAECILSPATCARAHVAVA